jgi:hypothetical protein
MPGRIFEDDPSIAGDERLLRRIPSTWIAWDGLGGPTDAVRNYPGYGLAAFTAAHARSLQQAVARDPLPEEPAWYRLGTEEARWGRRQAPRRSDLGRESDRSNMSEQL